MTSATDNRTTELLREGLTEHGIEWRSGLEGVTFVGDWCFVEYDNGRLAATCEPVLMPEQAIAVTLGRGTLTAEDVRSFLNRNSRFDDATWLHGSQELVFDEDDLQAMADELNAMFGSGTCEQKKVRQ